MVQYHPPNCQMDNKSQKPLQVSIVPICPLEQFLICPLLFAHGSFSSNCSTMTLGLRSLPTSPSTASRCLQRLQCSIHDPYWAYRTSQHFLRGQSCLLWFCTLAPSHVHDTLLEQVNSHKIYITNTYITQPPEMMAPDAPRELKWTGKWPCRTSCQEVTFKVQSQAQSHISDHTQLHVFPWVSCVRLLPQALPRIQPLLRLSQSQASPHLPCSCCGFRLRP